MLTTIYIGINADSYIYWHKWSKSKKVGRLLSKNKHLKTFDNRTIVVRKFKSKSF